MAQNEFTASPYRGAMIEHRARLEALNMCVAVTQDDRELIREICDAELRNGGTDFMTALARLAVQLARTVADRDEVSEADLWGLLLEQAKTSIIATAEIDRMTRTPNNQEDNNNGE
ncbi:hypothetical protein D2E76_27845 [Mycobacteroides abscessus]|uniref:Uncharacterized protein n=1 Tax=Mycobacteroides abscessus TaxID=36809 RepID=A0ABD7HFS7_9MYCO|nr:hypothetical protein [Mycobacteroides abscessus]RIT26818.1 hypothetical protein D2E76_27845 [Mycobacteroides abscessus]